MPLVAESLAIIPVLEIALLFGPHISEQSFNVGVEFSAYLPQPGLRDEWVVPADAVITLAPLIRVPVQDAARPEIERWLSAFRPRQSEFADLLTLYLFECRERDAARQLLIGPL